MCRYRYFLSNVSMYRYNTVSIHFKSIWYRYFFNHFLDLISVFVAFLCDNFCRNSKVTIIMFKNNVKRFLKCEILSIMENFYFWFDKNLNFLEYFGQKGVKYYQKKYRQHKMYWYTDTFSMKNVSMCQYRYILKVSDTDTVSNTKGLDNLNNPDNSMYISSFLVRCQSKLYGMKEDLIWNQFVLLTDWISSFFPLKHGSL